MVLINAYKFKRELEEQAETAALKAQFGLSVAADMVEHQPTAYDIERVVERLRYNAVEIEREDLCFCSYYVPLGKAIEIVKGGAK